MQNEIIINAKNGCEKSLGKIYAYLIGDVTAKTKSMLTNVSEFEVEDTIIVSMTKILTIGINSYQPSEASFRTFALRIAQNNALDTDLWKICRNCQPRSDSIQKNPYI